MKKAYIIMKKYWWLKAIIIVVTIATLAGNIYSYRHFDREDLKVVESTITDITLEDDEIEFQYVSFYIGEEMFYCNVNAHNVSEQLKGQYKDKTLTVYYTDRLELSIFGFLTLGDTKVVAIECEGNTIISVEETNSSNTFRFIIGAAISAASFAIWLIVIIGSIKDRRKIKNIAGVRLVEVGENGAYVVTKVLDPKIYTKIQNEMSMMKKSKSTPKADKLPGVMFTYKNGDYEIQTFCSKTAYRYTDSGLTEQSENTDYDETRFAWMIEKFSYMPEWYGTIQN